MAFSIDTLLIALLLGAACLAAWVAVRYPRLGPTSMGRAMLHLLAAFAAAQLVPSGIELLGRTELGGVATATMLVVLPGLTYMCLALLWLLRVVQTATGLGRS